MSMSNLKNYFLEVTLIALLVRCLISGTGIGEAIFAVSLVISITYKDHYIKKHAISEKDELVNKINEFDQKILDITSAINSLKLNNAMKRGLNEEKTLRKY